MDAAAGRKRTNRVGNLGSRIDHGHGLNSGTREVAGGTPAIVAGREHRDAPSRARREAIHIGTDRGRQHHAGNIIAAEHHRPFGRACRQQRAGHDFPEPLPRRERGGAATMISDALQDAVLAVIDAKHRGSAQQSHICHRGQFALRLRGPCGTSHAVNLANIRQQPSAEQEIFLDQDDAGPGAAGRKRSR